MTLMHFLRRLLRLLFAFFTFVSEHRISSYFAVLIIPDRDVVEDIDLSGQLNSNSHDEIFVATRAGWLISFTTETITKTTTKGPNMDKTLIAKSAKLETDIDNLRVKVEERKAENVSGLQLGGTVAITDSFTLNSADGSYLLTLECQLPLDNVVLQCDVPLRVTDMAANSSVVSFSQTTAGDGNAILATFRCQATAARLDIRVQCIEGAHGTLRVYITPRLAPKCCQVRQFQIRPLCLHQRAHSFDESRPNNVLHIKGPFSLNEIHAWLAICLPDLPERPANTVEPNSYFFKSILLDSQLHCEYARGEATFRTDNLSTLSVVKDFVAREATRLKKALEIACDVDDASVIHLLGLSQPLLLHHSQLQTQVQMVEPLRELVLQEGGSDDFLSDEYREVLHNAAKIQADFKRQPEVLNQLRKLYAKLYEDYVKYHGSNTTKNDMETLKGLVHSCDLDGLKALFATA